MLFPVMKKKNIHTPTPVVMYIFQSVNGKHKEPLYKMGFFKLIFLRI